jgi:hypothetical protein
MLVRCCKVIYAALVRSQADIFPLLLRDDRVGVHPPSTGHVAVVADFIDLYSAEYSLQMKQVQYNARPRRQSLIICTTLECNGFRFPLCHGSLPHDALCFSTRGSHSCGHKVWLPGTTSCRPLKVNGCFAVEVKQGTNMTQVGSRAEVLNYLLSLLLISCWGFYLDCSSTLKMEATCSSRISVDFERTKLCLFWSTWDGGQNMEHRRTW